MPYVIAARIGEGPYLGSAIIIVCTPIMPRPELILLVVHAYDDILMARICVFRVSYTV